MTNLKNIGILEYEADNETHIEDIGQIKNAEKQEQLKNIFDKNHIRVKTIKYIEE